MDITKIHERTLELIQRIRFEVLPEHKRRCEEREKTHPTSIRFDDEISRRLQSNSLVAELRRLQNACPHDFTDWQEDKTWSVTARTKRCKICQSNETIFSSPGWQNQ